MQVGKQIPSVQLSSTQGGFVDLSRRAVRTSLVFPPKTLHTKTNPQQIAWDVLARQKEAM